MGAKKLHEQVSLDAQSLSVQICALTGLQERAMATLFSVANQLNAAFCEYHEAVATCDEATRSLAVQQEAIHQISLCVDHLRDQLAETKIQLAAIQRLIHDDGRSKKFDVYADGCQPDEPQQPTVDSCSEANTPECLLDSKR